jgi:hypothetical protein
MKKIILLAFTTLIVGCRHSQYIPETKVLSYGFVIVEIDSCEYIGTSSSKYRDLFSYKGNCRFCKERRQNELKKLVEQLKEK